MSLAVEYLAGRGHTRIGLLIDGSPEGTISKQRRRAGFLQAVRKFRCENDPALIQNGISETWLEEIGRIIRAGATALISCGEGSGLLCGGVAAWPRRRAAGRGGRGEAA